MNIEDSCSDPLEPTNRRIQDLRSTLDALQQFPTEKDLDVFAKVSQLLTEAYPGSKWEWVAGCSNPEGAKARCGSCSCKVDFVDTSLLPEGIQRFEDIS